MGMNRNINKNFNFDFGVLWHLLASMSVSRCYGMFTPPDTDSHTDIDTDRIGLYCMLRIVKWSDPNIDACTDYNAEGYCIQFGAYIGTDKVEFNSFFIVTFEFFHNTQSWQ